MSIDLEDDAGRGINSEYSKINMETRRCSLVVQPVSRNLERNVGKLQVSPSGGPLITDHEPARRMADIRIMKTRNIKHVTLRLLALSCQAKEDLCSVKDRRMQ